MDTAPERLRTFVAGVSLLLGRPMSEDALLESADQLMRKLVARDDWLPHAFAAAHPQYYRQHLLYGDPLDRFSVVSFVWGPGQATPIHDHTVWGVIGMLRGAECSQAYAPAVAPEPMSPLGAEQRLRPGDTCRVSPSIGDIHRVRNAVADEVSISIHLYGGNIGRIQRHVFDAGTGVPKTFVSGYSNAVVPNLWGDTQA